MGIEREKTRKVKSEFWARDHQGHRAWRDMNDRTENTCTVSTSRCPIQTLRKVF